MRISKVKLDNYVCFFETPEFELGARVNVVLGKNNSGKTALIGALGKEKLGDAHRSAMTIAKPAPIVPNANVTQFWIQYSFEPNEALQIIRQRTEQLLIHEFPRILNGQHLDYNKLSMLFAEDLELRIHFRENRPIAVELPEHGTKCDIANGVQFRLIRLSLGPDASIDDSRQPSVYVSTVDDNLCWRILASHVMKSAYTFSAVRTVSDKSPGNAVRTLHSNASNLPQVLRTLEGDDRGLYRRYLRAVRKVFPEIRELRMHAVSGNDVEVLVEFIDPDDERSELAVPLHKCGIGLGQVLAILYVAVRQADSQIIIIDEPHSFLHPTAIRNLLKVLQQYVRHQYILATHSPTAIMSVQEKRILLVKRADMVSTVKSINVNDNSELEFALQDIGSRRSDIFGMDAVVWVEGKTDETCFNMIMKDHLPAGVLIIGLVNTGDLEDKKHALLAENIYEKLSGGVGILPSALAFIFDGDKRPDDCNEADISVSRKHYLKRETLENYFLDYDGIAEILSELINNEGGESPTKQVNSEVVQKWINENKEKKTFYDGEGNYDPETWPEQIDGARFLTTLFKALAHPTRKYKKVKDGEEITKRILADKPDHFKEIVDLITCILEKDKQRETA